MKKKITVTTKNIGKLYNNTVEEFSNSQAEKLAQKTEIFIKSQIKQKPKWFPSEKLWYRIACKFLMITYKF